MIRSVIEFVEIFVDYSREGDFWAKRNIRCVAGARWKFCFLLKNIEIQYINYSAFFYTVAQQNVINYGRKVEVSAQDKSVPFIEHSTRYPFKVIEVVPILTALGGIVDTTNEDDFVVYLYLTEGTAFRKVNITSRGRREST